MGVIGTILTVVSVVILLVLILSYIKLMKTHGSAVYCEDMQSIAGRTVLITGGLHTNRIRTYSI